MQPSALAARIKAAPPGAVNITFPSMAVQPYPYQGNDVAWMLAQRVGLVGSEIGTGKTILGIGAVSYLSDHDRLSGAVVLCVGTELPYQWESEFHRFAPGLRVVVGRGRDRAHRAQAYRSAWDVLILNYESARRDVALLRSVLEGRVTFLYADEATAFKNPRSQTWSMVKALAPLFEYRFAVTATPAQNNLEDLHGICDAIGMREVVGSRAWFQRTFCIREKVEFWTKGRRKRSKVVTVGYRNLDMLREMLEPWMVRRRREDPEVAKHIPSVQSQVVRLDMTPLQRRVHDRLVDGVLLELRGDGQAVPRYVDAVGRFMKLLGVADGLQTIDPEMRDESAKSDWLVDRLTSSPDWEGEKVVVFSRFARSLGPLAARLERAGVPYARFMGASWQEPSQRRKDLERFLRDPDCRVLLATQAVEMGLNLQAARVMVFYGILPNPARLTQIMGRIRRVGSPHASVMAYTLLSRGSAEEALWEAVIERNAVVDYLWEEESALFERLGVERLMQLIQGARVRG